MILLDSNVVSALMRLHLEPAVLAWLGTQTVERLFISTPTVFELRFGIEAKPQGRRRRTLQAAYDEIVGGQFTDRIMSFDRASAIAAGHARARQQKRGRTVSIPDSLIAGIALTLGMEIATRDIDDFAGLGIKLVNPWGTSV
jgi:toxin FitB